MIWVKYSPMQYKSKRCGLSKKDPNNYVVMHNYRLNMQGLTSPFCSYLTIFGMARKVISSLGLQSASMNLLVHITQHHNGMFKQILK